MKDENQINKVAIVGGTHGNEFTGVFLIKKFQQFPQLIQRSSFETITLLANPKAFEECRRYIDQDLNRSFLNQDLENPELSNFENIRAREINQFLGPKGQSQMDVIVDLHSTTANMGLSIIVGNSNPFILRLGAYLCSINPLVKVCCPRVEGDSSFLRSLSQMGFVIEVGPIAQGLINADLFQKTEKLIYTILDFLEAHNQGSILPINNTLTVYKYFESVDYPRNERGEIQAMIHPKLQFRDYEPLHPGDPMFLRFDEQEIYYQGKSTVYPVFINEAAYYEKGIAMLLTEQQQMIIS